MVFRCSLTYQCWALISRFKLGSPWFAERHHTEFAPFIDKIFLPILSKYQTWPGDITANVTLTPRCERVAFLSAVAAGTSLIPCDTYNFRFIQYQIILNFYLGENRTETLRVLQQIQAEFENAVLMYPYFAKTHIFLSAATADQAR